MLKSDERCIRTVEELIEYINKAGFLPLFKNDIPGFSVEEHTNAADWWSEDSLLDPWEWRGIITRGGKAAYGKFFYGKAGFISKQWFPYFANYRRDGYDFDSLWEDEKASMRQKKVMDLFEDEKAELYSFEIKKQAGFGKNGGKNFEGIMTSLQMQSYLCLRDFHRKRNKTGRAYGRSIAVYTRPETLWGYEYVTSAYEEEPRKSGDRIISHMMEIYPTASPEQILRAVASEESIKGVLAAKKKVICYPENLLTELDVNNISKVAIKYDEVTKDQLAGLEFTIRQLKENEQEVLHLRYKEGLTFKLIGEHMGLSGGRAGQIHAKAIRKLKHPARIEWYVYGYEKCKMDIEKQISEVKESMLS